MLSEELINELSKDMSIDRLTLTGLFVKLEVSDESLRPEITLHRAVLDRALIDSFHTNTKLKKSVDQWLDLDNPDFKAVCQNADLKPELVYELFFAMKKILKGDNAKTKSFH